MKNHYLTSSLVAAMALLSPCLASAQKANLPATEDKWVLPYGGTVPQYSYKAVNFYDNHNNLVRQAEYGKKNSTTDDLYLSKYSYYEYDEQGHLTLTYWRQGMWDDQTNEVSFKAPKDSVSYKYNEQGQLVEKTEATKRTTYEYDAEGNLQKESLYSRRNNVCQRVTTYSDYVAPQCPQMAVSESDVYDFYRYKEAYTYNEAHQKLSYEKYTEKQVVGEDGEETSVQKVVSQSTKWTYDAVTGRMSSEVTATRPFENSELAPSDSIAYTPVDGDNNRIQRTDYEYNAEIGQWVTRGGYHIITYQDYDASVAVELSVKHVEGSINNYAVSFPFTGNAGLGGMTYHIYRDGREIAVADFTAEGAVDPKTNVYTYVDKQVESGAHDYFVQTVHSDELETESYGMNVSNVVCVDHEVELPAVQNLRLATYKKDRQYGYMVTVAWDEPKDAELYGLQRYNVLIDGSEWADNYNTDGKELEWNVPLETKTSRSDVAIESVYPYGKSRATINIYMKDVIAGISQEVSSGLHTTYTGHVLHLSAPANVKVYSAAGQCVQTGSQVTSVSLDPMPSGTYLMLVEHNGNVSTLKVVR